MSGDPPTRQRILREAMRLFGQHGYAATSISMIEQAAGLSPGSGSLYKHFSSKQQLLSEGLDRLLLGTPQLTAMLEQAAAATSPLPRQRAAAQAALTATMVAVAQAGLARMEQDRDLNRLLFRGLDAFPELTERFRDDELREVQRGVAGLLAELGAQRGREEDWEAVSVVFVGAIAHYWLLRDLFGEHPAAVDEERYLAVIARIAAAAVLG